MSEILLYQWPGPTPGSTISAPCDKVQMALRFKGLEFRTEELDDPRKARRVNPRGRLPAARIDGELVVDSSDILTAVEARWPDPPLLPADPAARARCLLLEDWADEVVYFQMAYLRWQVTDNFRRFKEQYFRPHFGALLTAMIGLFGRREALGRFRGQGIGLKPEPVVRAEFAQSLEITEQTLGESPFLLGRTFSRADIALAAMLEQLRLPLTPGAAERIEASGRIVAWLDRVFERAPTSLR